MSIKLRNFATAKRKDRDLAQLVAHTSGGREVAGSSPVIPTKSKRLRIKWFSVFLVFPKLNPSKKSVRVSAYKRKPFCL